MKNQYKRFAKVMMGVAMVAGVSVGVGCATDATEPAEERASEVDQSLSGRLIFTTYYNNAAHDTVVGSCVQSTCPNLPKGRSCTGRTSAFSEVEFDTCN